MSHISALVRLPYATGLPTDVAVNTFHFDGNPADTDDIISILDNLEEFYTETATTNSIGQYLSSVVLRTTDACMIELYDMTQPKPRVVIGSRAFTIGASLSSASYPLEVALCNSFAAPAMPGVPRGRLRGRVFIGPLCVSAGSSTTGNPARPTATFLDDMVTAAQRLTVAAGADGVPWCVYSRTRQAIEPINHGWVDNEFDTQRRRGMAATDRNVWTLSV